MAFNILGARAGWLYARLNDRDANMVMRYIEKLTSLPYDLVVQGHTFLLEEGGLN